MATSFVTLGPNGAEDREPRGRARGFWANDTLLALVLRLLALQVRESAPGPDGKAARIVRDQWLLASGVPFPGCVPHGLEEIARNPACLSIARDAVASLLASMNGMPALQAGLFPLLGLGAPTGRTIDRAEIDAILHEMRKLMDERSAASGASIGPAAEP